MILNPSVNTYNKGDMLTPLGLNKGSIGMYQVVHCNSVLSVVSLVGLNGSTQVCYWERVRSLLPGTSHKPRPREPTGFSTSGTPRVWIKRFQVSLGNQ